MIAEKKALLAVLGQADVKGWRDKYDHEFQQMWQNQGPDFDVLHAWLRERRVEELLRALVVTLSKHVDLDE
jgi:hypothetical protein